MIDAFLIGAEELENLGARYLAAPLRRGGYAAEIAAFSTAEDIDTVVRRAESAHPRLIGLSIMLQYRAPEFLTLAAELCCVLPKAHITTGGHFHTLCAGGLRRCWEPRSRVPSAV